MDEVSDIEAWWDLKQGLGGVGGEKVTVGGERGAIMGLMIIDNASSNLERDHMLLIARHGCGSGRSSNGSLSEGKYPLIVAGHC